MKNKITKRLSLRAKFKSTSMIEVVIMDDKNNVQIELIPIKIGTVESKDITEDAPEQTDEQASTVEPDDTQPDEEAK